MTCYADDILIFTKKKMYISRLQQIWKRRVKLRDLGKLCHFLGIELSYNKGNEISLTQEILVTSLLESHKMTNGTPVKGPLSPKLDLNMNRESLNVSDAKLIKVSLGAYYTLLKKHNHIYVLQEACLAHMPHIQPRRNM